MEHLGRHAAETLPNNQEILYINDFTFSISDHPCGSKIKYMLAEVAVVIDQESVVVARFVNREDARRAITERYQEYADVAYASI
jgi:hypothetical protein